MRKVHVMRLVLFINIVAALISHIDQQLLTFLFLFFFFFGERLVAHFDGCRNIVEPYKLCVDLPKLIKNQPFLSSFFPIISSSKCKRSIEIYTRVILNCCNCLLVDIFVEKVFFLETHTHTREREMSYNTKTHHNSTQKPW